MVPKSVVTEKRNTKTVIKKKDAKAVTSIDELGFAYCGNSMVTMWHRPTDSHVSLLKELLGITIIVTVQRDSEQPQDVRKSCKTYGIEHVHICLEGANKPLLENKKT